jgi:cell wall-associated NlpC family hydrolase
MSAVLFVLDVGGPVWASHRSHRPWLMVGHKSHSRTAEKRRETALHPAAPTTTAPARVARATAPAMPNDAFRQPALPTDQQGEEVVHQALTYKGTRYRFGGETKRGLDCSGLVMRVYEDLRLKRIPRASGALYKTGKPVGLADLRPGDLVFFKNTYRHGISHVGIYAGNNKFVHAPNERLGVTITAMSEPYYQLHYAGARRLY